MSVVQPPATLETRFNPSLWIRHHPLTAYFAIAFAGTWILFIPVLLSERGLAVIALPEVAALLLFILSTYTGPFLSAFVVTGATEGRTGVQQLLRRMAQWRVGVQWYLLVLIGYPVVFILGATAALGTGALGDVVQNWPLILGLYLPLIPIGFLLPTLGEETGWRGVALPRLQQQYGPLIGSLVLGGLLGFWHLPAYFVQGAILSSGFEWNAFIANTLAIIASTIVWTWLFNHTKGSIFFATFVHATSNANSSLLPRLLSMTPEDPRFDIWFAFKVMATVALLLVVLTRGRLGAERAETERSPAQSV